MDDLVPQVRRLARSLSRRLPPEVDVDDLVGAGLLGITIAARRFVPLGDSAFGSYAIAFARGAMLEELRRRDPLSRGDRRHVRELRKVEHRLRGSLGCEPTVDQVAHAMGVAEPEHRAFLSRTEEASVLPIDAGGDRPGHGIRPSMIPSADAVSADDQLDQAQAKARAWRLVDGLPPRLAELVRLHYVDEKTLLDISRRFGVTESRVCQLHGDAMRKLRTAAAAQP